MDNLKNDQPESVAEYMFELPIGARVIVGDALFLHHGKGVFIGDKCPLVIEASMTAEQLSDKTLTFHVRRVLAGGEVLARELYLASGDIPSA